MELALDPDLEPALELELAVLDEDELAPPAEDEMEASEEEEVEPALEELDAFTAALADAPAFFLPVLEAEADDPASADELVEAFGSAAA